MSRSSQQQWLQGFNGAPERACYRKENGLWKKYPTVTQWRLDVLPMCRSPSFFSCMRHNYDWTFEQNDEGAVSITFDPKCTAASRYGFAFSLGSEMSDTQGYFIVLGERAQVYRPSTGSIEAGAGYGDVGYVEMDPAQVYSIDKPSLNNSGTISFIYEFGHLRIIDGADVNNPQQRVLVEFNDAEPIMGCHLYGFGLFGERNNTDEAQLSHIQKWSK